MKEEFILKLFEKFEKGKSVVMHIKEGDCEFLLKKEGAFPQKDSVSAHTAAPAFFAPQGYPVAAMPAQGVPVTPAPHEAPSTAQNVPASANAAPAGPSADKNLIFIKSPIVGTFYRAPSPDSPPYVEKGTAVKKGQPLCVLEAMKMMNTLECEYDGVIEDILASNGDLVEFDQNIFAIRITQ